MSLQLKAELITDDFAVSNVAKNLNIKVIPVIPTPNASHTSKLLISMCSRKDTTSGPFIKKIRKSNNLQKQQLSMLCSLPGVGEKTAVRMLEKFGTPLKVLSSSVTELSKVGGLGETRAKNIKKNTKSPK